MHILLSCVDRVRTLGISRMTVILKYLDFHDEKQPFLSKSLNQIKIISAIKTLKDTFLSY